MVCVHQLVLVSIYVGGVDGVCASVGFSQHICGRC
jgi:hypothetical protein